MKGAAIIIVGYQGAGKSLLAKAIIKNVHPKRLCILDINNEYSDYGAEEPDFDDFTNQMLTRKETVFICEDSTTIFSHRGYDVNLVRAIIKKRHSKNVFVFLFHSLRVIPRDVFEYSDQLWLLKTNDTDDTVQKKYQGTGVLELITEVRQLPPFKFIKGKQELPVQDLHYKVLDIKGGKSDITVEVPKV